MAAAGRAVGARLPARGRGRRVDAGQATTETMLMMSFLLLMIFGVVHMAMLMSTKAMVNYAAWTASRAAMVGGSHQLAAMAVMDNLRWTTPPIVRETTKTIRGRQRRGMEVTVFVRFGLPIFNAVPTPGVRVVGFAPLARQPNIPERGDNR